MNDSLDYLTFHLKALFGCYRPAPLLAAHVSLALTGGVLLDRLQQYWGEFFLSYALILTTILWFFETLFTLWNALKNGSFSPTELAQGCGKWLLWVCILFVAYSLALLDPTLSLIAKTMQVSVLLTQALYVVRGAAQLLNNPLADQLLRLFQGRLEQRIQEIFNEISTARDLADQARSETQQILTAIEELQAQKTSIEERLARLEPAQEAPHAPAQ